MINWNPVFIRARDLDDCFFQCLLELYEHGRRYKITSGSYEGQERLAFDFVSGFVKYPSTRPLAPRMPESSTLPPPTTDEEIEHYFVEYLMDASLPPNTHYKYSSYIVGGNKLCKMNQLSWIINHLKESPGNEHCAMMIGEPEGLLNYDSPYKHCTKCNKWFGTTYKKCAYCGGELESHEDKRLTTPCLRMLDFRLIDNYLMCHVCYRSWDIMALPSNLGGFTLLMEYMSQEIGCEVGPLAFSCKSLHAYSHAFDYLKQRLNK